MTSEQRPFHFRRILSGFALTAVMLALEAAGASNAPPAGGTGPVIASLSPEEGAVGTVVTVTGTNFGPAIGARQGTSGVSFNGVWASPAYWSETEIRVPVPPGASRGPVVVTVSGQGSSGAGFSVTGSGMAGPSIGTVSPALGAVGTVVTVRGADFGPPIGAEQGASTVSFNGMVGVPSSWSETEVRAPVPEGAQSGLVVVTADGAASDGVTFRVSGPAPVIGTVNPTFGPEGTWVVIRGENFGSPIGAAQGRSGVSFNGVWTSPSSWSGTEIRVPVPEGVTSGLVVVRVDGAVSNGVEFTVTMGKTRSGGTTVSAATARDEEPGPVITGLDPDEGQEGMLVTVRGRNFGAAAADTSTVSFFNSKRGVPTSWSETEIRVPVPEGTETGSVVVRVDGAVSNGVEFREVVELRIEAGDSIVREPNGETTITVQVSAEDIPSVDDVSFLYGGSALEGVDYTMETLEFMERPGLGRTTLTVVNDEEYEGPETIRIRAVAVNYHGDRVVSSTLVIVLEDDDPPPLRLRVEPAVVAEPDGTATLTVSIPEPAVSQTELVRVTLHRAGTARPGRDYRMGQRMTLHPGQISKTTRLEVVDDAVYEGEEEVRVYASAAGFEDSAEVVIRLEDDELPPLTLKVEPAVVAEPVGTATLKVSIPKPAVSQTDAVTVTLLRTGTARPGRDYTLARTVTIPPGTIPPRGGWIESPDVVEATSYVVVRIRLQVLDDAVYEGEKEVRVYASAAGFEDSREVTVRLEDDELPPLRLTVEPAVVAEPDGTATLTVSIPAEAVSPTDAVTVTLYRTGTATPGNDYTLAQTVTIPPGRSSAKTRLEVVDDAEYEGEEEVRVYASAAGFRDSREVTVRLEDDDPPPLRLTVEPAVVAEPDGTAVLTVSIPEAEVSPTDAVTVTLYRTGTATPGSDYTLAQTVTIPPGRSSATKRLEVVDDAEYEGEEEVRVYASAAGFEDSREVTVRLEDDDPPPLRLTVEPAVVAEPDGTAVLTVSIPEAEVSQTVAVTVTLHATGTATPGRDYTLAQTVTIPSGQSSETTRLEVEDDSRYEPTETILIQATAQGYRPSDMLTITVENDDPPLVTLVCPQSLTESSDPDTVLVLLPKTPDEDTPVEFSFEGTATRGDDYTMVETVTIEAGSKRERPQLTVIDDLIYEGAETILIEASAEGYVTDNCLIQLGDNDPETGVTVSPSSLSITEGESGQYQVKLASQPSASVTIAIGSSNGDVEVNPASLTFTTGETGNWNVFQGVTVQVVHDDDSADEPATLTHTASSGDPNYAGIAGPGVSVSVTDNTPAGVTVTPTSLSITEGESRQYQVKLISQPTAPVAITLTSSNGDVQVPASLTIAPSDWRTPKTVTVQVAHDDDMEDETGTITHVASSGDRKYDGIDVAAVSVQITDQVPGVTVTPTRLRITEGQSKSYQVRLKTRPSASVTISMSSSNGDVGVPSTPLIFTTSTGVSGGWDQFRSVTVRIAHDDNTTDESGTITHESSSNDPNYHERPDISAVSVQVTDDDPEEPENQPPVPVGTMPNQTLDEGERKRIGLSPYFNDPDGDDLTYSAISSNANVEVSVTGSTLTIRGVSEGTATVTVTAKDPDNLSAMQKFDVEVESLPPPKITCSAAPEKINPGGSSTLSWSTENTDSVTITPDPGIVGETPLNGSHSVSPGSTESYEFEAEGDGGIGECTATVTVNRAPVPVGTMPNQTLKERERKRIGLPPYFSDPDGDDLTYSAISSNANVEVSVTGSTLTIRGVSEGTATVTVTAKDPDNLSAMQKFDVEVESLPPPKITCSAAPEKINPGGSSTLSWSTENTDSVTITPDPGIVGETPLNGSHSVSPGSTESYEFEAEGDGGIGECTATVTVNRAPVPVGTMPNQTLKERERKRIGLPPYFSDPDGDDLTYSAISSNANVEVSVTGSTLTIRGVSEGTATVTVTAKDPDNLSAMQKFDVEVESLPPPKITCSAAPEKINPGGSSTLSWSTENTDSVTITPDPGIVGETPLNGSHSVSPGSTESYEFEAEGDGGIGECTATVTVNRAPVPVGTMPNQTLKERERKRIGLSPYFNDPDGDDLTYSAISSNANLEVSVTGSTLTIRGVSEGTATVTVTATDPGNLSAMQKFDVEVESLPPPKITCSAAPAKINPGGSSTLSWSTEDTDSVTITPDPGIVGETPLNGSHSVSPGSTESYEFEAVGDGGIGECTATVTVNRAPVPVGTMPNQTLKERERKRIGLSPYFNDPDGDDLTYSAISSNANVEVSVTGSTLTIRGVSEGTATVTVTAKDPMRLSAKQTFDVTVEPPPGPEITSIRPGLQRPDDPVTIYGSNFGSVAGSVSFGGHNVGDYNFTGPDSDYSWSNTSIGLLIPASAQPETVSVTVTTSAGQTSNSKSYTITGGPLPRPEDECEGEEEDCPDDTKKGGGSNDAEEETDSEESEDSPEDGG